MIFVNFKTYEKGSGEEALSLLTILQKVAQDEEIKIIPAVQATDIREAVMSSNLEIWSQHIDPDEFGAHTGAIIAEGVKEDGAMGTFLNHSEHKFSDFEKLRQANKRALMTGLKTLVFAANISELKKIVTLNPTFVAYEPPELVGSKTTSVSEAKADIIKEAVELTHEARLPLIVGAGIKSQKDVAVSVELGADGIAVASDVVGARDPEKELRDLIAGLR